MALPAGGQVPDGYGHLRSSRADRERTVDLLKAAFEEGRLDQDELAERAGQAYSSRTYAELAALTADLPVRLPAARLAAASGPAGRRAARTPAAGISSGQPTLRLPGHPGMYSLPGDNYEPHGLRGLYEPPAGQAVYRLPPPPPAACRVAVRARGGGQVSGLAIAAAILGFGGLVTLGITAPFAFILGIAALPRLSRVGEKGAGLAFLGILLGLIGTLFILLPELLMGRLLP
jgi:hypothetical protein